MMIKKNFFIIIFFLLFYNKSRSQDTLKGNFYVSFFNSYFELLGNYNPPDGVSGPEGNLIGLNLKDTLTNIKGRCIFITDKIPKKIKNSTFTYLAPFQITFNDTIKDYYLDNENIKDLIFNKKIKKKEKWYNCIFNKRKFLLGITYYYVRISFVIKSEKNITYLSEEGQMRKSIKLVKITSISPALVRGTRNNKICRR